MKERLTEILINKQYGHSTYEEMADYLLANGVIVPPCKVGQTVFVISVRKVRERKVISIVMLLSEDVNNLSFHCVNSRGAIITYELHEFGKTVFLTKEEAEKALAERKNDEQAD